MNFSSEFFINVDADNVHSRIPVNEDCFYNKEVALEPIPIVSFPPESKISAEEFKNELNLLLKPMDVDASFTHDP
ncbi:hypothetical protein MKX01_011885, partial [Papaver californicum]